jgi:putative intracellular protease/amidase
MAAKNFRGRGEVMAAKMLEGKKVAVLVESEFIPEEIEAYQTRFAEYGATVHLMSRLWDQAKQTFVSDVQHAGETPKILEVDIDFQTVNVDDYAAVIMAANYTSVRLRYFEPPNDAQGHPLPIAPEMARTAPAVRFFGRAMRNPRIVKGALCHALWLLTPMPELLAGRRVICHQVVLADVINAGAIYVSPTANGQPPTTWQPAPGVVVDGDFVTGRSALEVHPFVDAIAEQIVRREHEEPRHSAPSQPMRKQGAKKILIVLSEWGYWGEELVGPLETFDAAGYEVDFVTPRGRRPVALTPSMDAEFIDPPLGRPVTSEEVARKTRELDKSPRLDHPINLSEWVPERPYWSAPTFVRGMEAYNRALDRVQRDLEQYDALLIVGGSGPIVDLVNNQRVHDLILCFYRLGKPIAAECYGVPCLAFARDIEDRGSIIWGKHVTGHCLEYDYKDGTGFMGTDFNMGPPPYPLEYILRDATGPEGGYHGNFGKETSVIVDYPFITGRSTPDSYLTGQQVVEVLENGLRRYGW